MLVNRHQQQNTYPETGRNIGQIVGYVVGGLLLLIGTSFSPAGIIILPAIGCLEWFGLGIICGISEAIRSKNQWGFFTGMMIGMTIIPILGAMISMLLPILLGSLPAGIISAATLASINSTWTQLVFPFILQPAVLLFGLLSEVFGKGMSASYYNAMNILIINPVKSIFETIGEKIGQLVGWCKRDPEQPVPGPMPGRGFQLDQNHRFNDIQRRGAAAKKAHQNLGARPSETPIEQPSVVASNPEVKSDNNNLDGSTNKNRKK